MESNKRYELEFCDGKSNKFWAITVDGVSFTVGKVDPLVISEVLADLSTVAAKGR